MCSCEAEDFAAVAAQAFEDAVAVQQAVVVDADLGVFLRNELAADVDLSRHASWRGGTAVEWLMKMKEKWIASLYGPVRVKMSGKKWRETCFARFR